VLAGVLFASTTSAQTLRLTDPLLNSPTDLARLASGRVDAGYLTATSEDEQTYDAGGGGRIKETVKDSGARVIYATPLDASTTIGLGLERRDTAVTRDTDPGVVTERERYRYGVTAGGSFKIMDRIVLGGGLGFNQLSSDDGPASTFWSADLAIALRGEALDISLVQHVARLALPNDESIWTHGQDLAARYQTQGPSAWRLLIQRGPQTYCCVPATTRRLTYAVGNERLLTEAVELTVVVRHAPAFKEKARYGHVYDIARYGIDIGGEYLFGPRMSAGLTAAYEFGRDDSAAVEIPTALETVDTAAYKASRLTFGLIAGVSLQKSLESL
jgi:hypothetical protein